MLMGRRSHKGLEKQAKMEGGVTGHIGQLLDSAARVQIPVYMQHHALDASTVVDNGGCCDRHHAIVIILP
jgi:hypothetical protein